MFCSMCRKWADEAHLSSRAHRRGLDHLRSLDPDQRARLESQWRDEMEGRALLSVEKKDEQEFYLQQGQWQYCVLCLQWEDGRHQNSKKHTGRVAYCAQLTAPERREHLRARYELARHDLRAGAEDSPDDLMAPEVSSLRP